jgi:hypothetical protein
MVAFLTPKEIYLAAAFAHGAFGEIGGKFGSRMSSKRGLFAWCLG